MADIDVAETKVEVVEFKAGDFIFKETEPSSCLYVLREGQVEVHKAGSGGQRIPLAIVSSGQFLGELSLISRKAHTATAMALTPVTAVKITKEVIEAQMKSMPYWLSGLMRCLVDRLHVSNEVLKRNNLIDNSLMKKMTAAEAKVATEVSKKVPKAG